MVPAATGTDTAGSLRIPSALSGTSTIKPTRGLVSTRGVVPLAFSLDHAGPMARTLEDCAALLAALAGPDRGRPASALAPVSSDRPLARRAGPRPLAGVRLAVSPRLDLVELDSDVADGFDGALEACRRLGASIVAAPAPDVELEIGDDYLDVFSTEVLVYHRRFDSRRDLYRPSIREWVELGERRAVTGEAYVVAQARRRDLTATWEGWFAVEGVTALIEPTVPVVAPLRGSGYDHAGTDFDLISLTYYSDWTGFPVVALPFGVGSRSGLPVSVSLIGPAGTDWEILSVGAALQGELGIPGDPCA